MYISRPHYTTDTDQRAVYERATRVLKQSRRHASGVAQQAAESAEENAAGGGARGPRR